MAHAATETDFTGVAMVRWREEVRDNRPEFMKNWGDGPFPAKGTVPVPECARHDVGHFQWVIIQPSPDQPTTCRVSGYWLEPA